MSIKTRNYVRLADYATLKVGGTARYFAEIFSVKELQEAVSFAREKNIPLVILGGGSNVLLSDSGVDGLVVKVSIKGTVWSDVDSSGRVGVSVGAGESWDDFVRGAVEKGFWGLENLSGIPGTVGASPVQNIGAYGAEVKDVIVSVETFNRNTGETRKLFNKDCAFSYRASIFKTPVGATLIITSVSFRLSKRGKPNISYKDLTEFFSARNTSELIPRDVREAVLQIRRGKFPPLSVYGTAGSFFKNPIVSAEKCSELLKKFTDLPNFPMADGRVKLSAAWILDKVCGLKGFTIGRVALYEKQPIVIVNLGGAKAEEIEALARAVEHIVFEKTGIHLEREVASIKV